VLYSSSVPHHSNLGRTGVFNNRNRISCKDAGGSRGGRPESGPRTDGRGDQAHGTRCVSLDGPSVGRPSTAGLRRTTSDATRRASIPNGSFHRQQRYHAATAMPMVNLLGTAAVEEGPSACRKQEVRRRGSQVARMKPNRFVNGRTCETAAAACSKLPPHAAV
jgi:hypothetical protein